MSARTTLLSFRLVAAVMDRLPAMRDLIVRFYNWQEEKFPQLLTLELWVFDTFLIISETLFFLCKPLLMLHPRMRQLAERHLNLTRNLLALSRTEAVLSHYRQNNPANVYLNFSQKILERAEDLDAEVFLSHGVQALPAAFSLSSRLGRPYYCDCVESPSFFDRAIPSQWHVTNTEMLDNAFESYLRRADGVLTIGWTLADNLRGLNAEVSVIPNYRASMAPVSSNKLREMCEVTAEEEVILSLSTVTSGFREVLGALPHLPENVHLASIGNYVPASYGDECRQLADELGVADRYHTFPPVPYDELVPTISSADVGLFVCDTSIKNNAVSLPNRVFDFMAAGVPLCAPDIPDISKIIQTENMGGVVTKLSATGWAETIKEVLAAKTDARANALAASTKYTWESVEADLYTALGRPKSICILGATDLTINNRTRRIAKSLRGFGCEVKICFLVRGDDAREPHQGEDGVYYVPVHRSF